MIVINSYSCIIDKAWNHIKTKWSSAYKVNKLKSVSYFVMHSNSISHFFSLTDLLNH